MAQWVPPEKRPPKPPPPDWKPARCACGAKHPSHSFNGMEGPWLCAACAKAAQPTVFERLYREHEASPKVAQNQDPIQGSLL